MAKYSKTTIAVASAGLVTLLIACGGGGGGNGDDSSIAITPYNPYNPSDPIFESKACVPGNDVVGAWKVVANNETLMPNSPQLAFFSYNQPSVNGDGLVVFRGRAKSASASSGEIQRGYFMPPPLVCLRDPSTR